MAVDPFFAEAWGYVGITIGSTNVVAGDALFFDGTDWELADASDNTKFAELFAAESYDTGARGVGVVGGILEDTDDPFTQNDNMYLSETAGAITATRPTVDNSLAQVLGFCLSTSQVNLRIKIPTELTMWVDLPYAIGAAAVTSDGDWAGLSMTADSDGAGGTSIVPQQAVAIKYVAFWGYVEDTLASGNYTFDVSAGINSDADTGATTQDGVTTTALAVVTADDIFKVTATAGMNAAGIADSGNHIGIQIDKLSETAADDFRFHGVEITYLVV